MGGGDRVARQPPRRDAAVRVGAVRRCNCLDPAGYDADDWPALSLAYDGLVAYRRIAGAGGSTLVPDLAASVPEPSDGGRTYTFQLRPGLRFSDGAPVRPEDFRASIERAVRLAGQGAPFYGGIAGAEACSPRRCDLSKGIETDAAARTITIHLRRPDAEFLHKLALPLAYVLPRGRRRGSCAAVRRRGRARTGSPPSRPGAACGWCATRAFARGRPRRAPTASPTRSTSRSRADAAAQVAAVQHGRADAVVAAGAFGGQLPLDQDRALALADASHVLHRARAEHQLALRQRPSRRSTTRGSAAR